MTDLNQRDHGKSEFCDVVQDPVVAGTEPLGCRQCKKGKVGAVVDGRASCNKCGRLHGFIVLGGKVCYGVYL